MILIFLFLKLLNQVFVEFHFKCILTVQLAVPNYCTFQANEYISCYLQLLFDFLAFKNDISFWKKKRSMIGMSTKAGMGQNAKCCACAV